MMIRITGNTWLTRIQPFVTGRSRLRNRASAYDAGSATISTRIVVSDDDLQAVAEPADQALLAQRVA